MFGMCLSPVRCGMPDLSMLSDLRADVDDDSILDYATLGRLRVEIGDDESVVEFLERFLELLPERLERIAMALAADERYELDEGARSLAISSSMAGLNRLANVAHGILIADRRLNREFAALLEEAMLAADRLNGYLTDHAKGIGALRFASEQVASLEPSF